MDICAIPKFKSYQTNDPIVLILVQLLVILRILIASTVGQPTKATTQSETQKHIVSKRSYMKRFDANGQHVHE